MTRLLVAALLTTVVALPAMAQSRNPNIPPQERIVALNGYVGDKTFAPGLPGVAMDANRATDRPSGPGGLSNGVGGVGTLMPNSSSSNGQLLDSQGGFGFPLSTPRRYVD